MKPVTQQAHEFVTANLPNVVFPSAKGRSGATPTGRRAIDATAGNGHDTLFLARLVGEQGQVWAFDIQANAIQQTARRLAENQISCTVLDARAAHSHHPLPSAGVIAVEGSHAEMLCHLPQECQGDVAVVMFNLGYLPGGDKTRITHTESTLAALDAAMQLLAPLGLLTVIVYPGHSGGDQEATAVREWFVQQENHQRGALLTPVLPLSVQAPQLLAIQRTLQ